MELESLLDFIQNKNILVTGAAGFLAKNLYYMQFFVEKILRVQPNVKKLYLLLRAPDTKTATQRLHNEILGKDLFRVVREKWGARMNSIVSEKLTMVPGDISKEGLGLQDSDLREEILSQVDVIVNLAATTNFDERYDVALGLNTMGAKYVMSFAKLCVKLEVLVHVSTAYVWGEKAGLLPEHPCLMGKSLNGTPGLDIETEIRIANEEVRRLRSEQASEATITLTLKDIGLKRASIYGWPNTYVFTKALGEMLIGEHRGNLPVVILRPTIITSTYKEPFPGWVEGIRTIDSVVVGYGKGKLTFFLCDVEAIVDIVPADMVVNAIVAAMVAHANEPGEVIYQVGSSVRNPVRYNDVHDYGFRYFTRKPWINKDGKPVTVHKCTVMSSMDSFRRYMTLRYLLLLKGLELVNIAFCKYFEGTYTDLNRKIKFVMRLVELYRPYLFFNGVFDDLNTEKLRIAVRETTTEADMFYFDPKIIDWEDYFMNTHISGVVKYVFK